MTTKPSKTRKPRQQKPAPATQSATAVTAPVFPGIQPATQAKADARGNSKVVALRPEFAKLKGHGLRIQTRASLLSDMLGPDGRDCLVGEDHARVAAWKLAAGDDSVEAWAAFAQMERGIVALTPRRAPRVVTRAGVVVPGLDPFARQPAPLTRALYAKALRVVRPSVAPTHAVTAAPTLTHCICSKCGEQIVPVEMPDGVVRLKLRKSGHGGSAPPAA